MKRFFAIALLSFSGVSHAMVANKQTNETIILPSKSELNLRFSEAALDHFAEKTQLGATLGGQKKYPLGVLTAVELALADYDEYLKQPMMSFLMQKSKPRILECILKDFPEALAEVKQTLETIEAEVKNQKE